MSSSPTATAITLQDLICTPMHKSYALEAEIELIKEETGSGIDVL